MFLSIDSKRWPTSIRYIQAFKRIYFTCIFLGHILTLFMKTYIYEASFNIKILMPAGFFDYNPRNVK